MNAAAAVLVAVSAGSCRSDGSPHVARTRTDRLRDAYPALRQGPFALIADFEDSIHYELFHASAETPMAAVRPDATKGRSETGPACVAFTTSAASDALVVNNAGAANWYLKRDWRQFNLLLMSVYAPFDGLMLDLAVTSGRFPDQVTAEATLPLREGWNALRLDLGELGEQITLDEVQELRFSVGHIERPVTIYFDDLILSASREGIFGDPSNRDGELYVQRVGRRWHVGAGGAFEVVFANGQITGWYNLAADPHRLVNLVRGTSLGPTPVAATEHPGGESPLRSASGQVVARQVIREMNAVRVVIETEWRFVAADGDPQREPPDYRWLYTIYPTGQIYVGVEDNVASDESPERALELAVALAAPTADAWGTRVVRASRAERGAITVELPAYVSARSEVGEAFFLFVPWAGEGEATLRASAADSQAPLTFVASYRGTAGSPNRAACHLWLSPTAEVSDREALERARAYATPPPLDARIGKLVVARDESFGGAAGFAAAGGTFLLAPEGGRVLVGLGSGQRPHIQPAFSIERRDDLESWVYANHLILEPTAIDHAGNLIFQIRGAVREPMLVEVLFRQPQTTSGS